jgi:hypothetical protein
VLTFVVVLLEVWAAVRAGVEVAVANEDAEHGFLVFLGRIFRVVCGEAVQD